MDSNIAIWIEPWLRGSENSNVTTDFDTTFRVFYLSDLIFNGR